MLVPCYQNTSEGNQIAFPHNCGAILQRFLCLRNRKIVIDPLLTQNPKKWAGLGGNNGKPAERTVVKSANWSRNDSDLCVRQPTDQQAGSSSFAIILRTCWRVVLSRAAVSLTVRISSLDMVKPP